MIKQKSFEVLVKKRDMDKLLSSLSPSLKQFKISARPQVTPRTIFLASLSFEVRGEEQQVDAFRELVQTSALTYNH